MDGVVIIVNFHGKAFRVIFYHQSEQDFGEKIQRIRSICGRRELMVWRGGFPQSEAKLGRTDWEVIKALGKDPRRSLTEIAQDAKISTRTVRRRLDLMVRGMAFYLLPTLDYDKSVGVGADYLIFCPDEKKKQTIDKLVRSRLDRLVFLFTDAKGFSIYATMCINITEAEEIQRWIAGLEGVEEVRMDTMRSNTILKGWLDREIDKRLSAASNLVV